VLKKPLDYEKDLLHQQLRQTPHYRGQSKPTVSGMRRLIFPIVFLFFIMGCQPKDERYVHYHNERFGFELAYPSFMTKDPPPENGDGISCQGKGLTLIAYGGLNLDSVRPSELDGIFRSRHFADSTGTIHVEKSGYFSNTDNGDINLTLHLTYPQGQIDSMVIKRILDSFWFNGIN
jgi:hypothetical protein